MSDDLPDSPHSDETAAFLRECEEIEDGLHELADDIYELTKGEHAERKDEIVSLAQSKVGRYDEFIAGLSDDDDIEEAKGVLERYIERIRRNLGKLES